MSQKRSSVAGWTVFGHSDETMGKEPQRLPFPRRKREGRGEDEARVEGRRDRLRSHVM